MPILGHLTKQEQEKQEQDMGAGQTPETGSLQNVPVLIIEDDPDMAWEITNELTRLGYRVRVAETDAEGLAAARGDQAALLIVDRMLNGVDSLSMIEPSARKAYGFRFWS